MDHEHYVIILRKKVQKPKVHYQLRLFSPDNGNYEYSAVLTNSKTWKPKDLLLFVSGRSAQENSISELKTSFAFDHIPTNTYQANSAHMQMSQMAYDWSISMQHRMGMSTDRDTKGKSTRKFKSMKRLSSLPFHPSWQHIQFSFKTPFCVRQTGCRRIQRLSSHLIMSFSSSLSINSSISA